MIGLHVAVLKGDAACVRLLLGESGDAMSVAGVNLTTKKGSNPLQCAIKTGSVSCIQLLLAAGARRTAKRGPLPLECARHFHPGNAELLALLDLSVVRSKPLVCDCCSKEADLDECACGAAWYCSSACQTTAWAAHQRRCNALRAEQAASAHAF
jgi:hypothetical protein